jgi:hypothetical protein
VQIFAFVGDIDVLHSLFCLLFLAGDPAAHDISWLKLVPRDVPIVIRLRAIDDVQDDLFGMLDAMSPNLAAVTKSSLEPELKTLVKALGPTARKTPLFLMYRLPNPDEGDYPGGAMILKSKDYKALLKGFNDGAGVKPERLDGYDSFTTEDDKTWYALEGQGWVAMGTDEEMIQSLRKPEAVLDRKLTPELKAKFAEGDISLYLNLAEVDSTYGPLIQQFKPLIVQQLKQNRDPRSAQFIQLVDTATEALHSGDGFVLNADFDASGFTLGGLIALKSDSEGAKYLAQAKTRSLDLVSKLPDDLSFYVVESLSRDSEAGAVQHDPATNEEQQSPPELRQAIAARQRSIAGKSVMGMTFIPMRTVMLVNSEKPAAIVEASIAASRVRQKLKQEVITIAPNVVNHRGFQLNKLTTQISPEQLANAAAGRLPSNVADPTALFQRMIKNDSIMSFTGADDKLFIETTGYTEEEIKAQLDMIKDGTRNLSNVDDWKFLKARLPQQVSLLVILNSQETVKMALAATTALKGVPELKLPAGLPTMPALTGFSLIASKSGYDFKLIIPKDVIAVFEKGIAEFPSLE